MKSHPWRPSPQLAHRIPPDRRGDGHLSWASVPVRRHGPVDPLALGACARCVLGLPHPARSPLELSRLHRGLLSTDCHGLISYRSRPSGFITFRAFPAPPARGHFWRVALLTLRDEITGLASCLPFLLRGRAGSPLPSFRRSGHIAVGLATSSDPADGARVPGTERTPTCVGTQRAV